MSNQNDTKKVDDKDLIQISVQKYADDMLKAYELAKQELKYSMREVDDEMEAPKQSFISLVNSLTDNALKSTGQFSLEDIEKVVDGVRGEWANKTLDQIVACLKESKYSTPVQTNGAELERDFDKGDY